MSERLYCCEALEKVTEGWDGPFHWPIYVERETMNLRSDKLAVKLYNLTPSRKGISAKGRTTLFLSYCPLCGEKLQEGESNE